jgi:hypothetical protein
MEHDSAELARRLLGAVHLSLGTALITRPGSVSRLLGGRTPPHRWVIRLLGARSLVQGAVTAVVPDAPIVAAGAVVDGVHALSMIVVAALAEPQRRAAALSAVVAAGCSGAGTAAARLPRSRVRSASGA